MIGAIILVTWIFNLLHKQRERKKLLAQKGAFNNAVAKHNLQISEEEQINNYLFAIDRSNAFLLHLDFSKAEEQLSVTDLSKVKEAKVVTEENSLYEMKQGKSVPTEKHITKMQLALTFIDTNQPQQLLALYQYEDGMQNLSAIRKRGEHWQTAINVCIKQLSVARKVNVH